MSHRSVIRISPNLRHTRALVWLSMLSVFAACQSDPITGPARAAESLSLQVIGVTMLRSIGDTATVRAVTLDAVGAAIDASVVWSLSNGDVVEQLGSGQFRAIGNGRVTITATVSVSASGVRPTPGYFATRLVDSIRVEVRQAPASATSTFDSTFKMVGESRPIEITVLDMRGRPISAAVARPVFQSDNATVVRVDSTGTVRTLKEGIARISALVGDVRWSTTISVQPNFPHTSCMVYVRRRRSQQVCVVNELVLHVSRGGS